MSKNHHAHLLGPLRNQIRTTYDLTTTKTQHRELRIKMEHHRNQCVGDGDSTSFPALPSALNYTVTDPSELAVDNECSTQIYNNRRWTHNQNSVNCIPMVHPVPIENMVGLGPGLANPQLQYSDRNTSNTPDKLSDNIFCAFLSAQLHFLPIPVRFV